MTQFKLKAPAPEFQIGDKVYIYNYDYANDRGQGPSTFRVYGFISKVNRVTCLIDTVDGSGAARRKEDIYPYVDPFNGVTLKYLTKLKNK
jgi:hypothetical protein